MMNDDNQKPQRTEHRDPRAQMTPRKPDILDPVYLRSIGMFERANLLNAGDEPWKQRGIKDELRHEYENYPRVGKVVHRRSDS